ncbi:M23 family metallopeptidase [Balneola vulgaris]|jgi:murein DD-endopeptidase MepM/ murein hydrolase activator NlpD|uniref:M23 family metallopeptidase n=1 Tax=Balneola vulgaris TaxID=287535 RepID=UPI0003604498|nr:M23 family metallopeptidase [Balneola vulgaris]
MPLKNHFYYDEQKCEFIPIEYNKAEQVVYNLSVWILTGVVLSGLGIMLLSNFVGTPAELALKAENDALAAQLEETKESILSIDEQLQEIAKNDNEIYRSVLGLEDISSDEREAGTGGALPDEELDVFSESTAELLRWTTNKLNNLERKINIQKLSFEELKEAYNNNAEKLKHIPAIKPTKGILLSSFGMRDHPVLGYTRMHAAADFRADIGSEVYATANGTIKYVGLRGTLGRIVVIDHGYGYETLYAHLSSVPKGLKKGNKVNRGDLIAYSGNSGLTEGPHLHYEVHLNDIKVDPINYLFADISPEEYLMFKEFAKTNTKSMD